MNWENYWVALVLVAAFSHALWNFLVKSSADKSIFLWGLRVWAVIVFLPVSIFFWPNVHIPVKNLIIWGGGSIVFHGLYGLILSKAYEKSDFTLAYPVARGIGPLLVVFVGLGFLKEDVTIYTILGTFLILMGIYSLYSGFSWTRGRDSLKAMIVSPYPILVGVMIACYTVFDKLAIRYIPPITLNVIENFGQVMILGLGIYNKGLNKIGLTLKKEWPKMALGGFLSGLAYIIVLIVLTKVPVSRVAPLRESSIIIGSILGILFLKEKFTIQKAAGATLLFIGVILIVLK